MNKILMPIGAVLLLVVLSLVFLQPSYATMYKGRIDVLVNDADEIVFRLASDSALQVPINVFSVVGVAQEKFDYRNPRWMISMPAGSYKRISELKYGEGVEGFSKNDAKELIAGERYLASMSGAGFSESIEFELVRCAGKLAVRVLTK